MLHQPPCSVQAMLMGPCSDSWHYLADHLTHDEHGLLHEWHQPPRVQCTCCKGVRRGPEASSSATFQCAAPT
jgi:hypothetical protein